MQNWVDNEAVLEDNKIIDHSDCRECEEKYLFRMKDSWGEFFLGLRTVLACLAMADKEGIIPPISQDWWFELGQHY